MRTSYLFIYSLLVLAIFSCTSYDDELIAEKNQVKARCIVPEDSTLLKICEDYNYLNYPNCEFLFFHINTIEKTPDALWQLQYRNKNGNWEFVKDSQYDYGTFSGGGSHRTPKSSFQYGNVDFRARRIGGFIYMQEVNPIPGYVTDWTPICTVYNNYVDEVGVITDSYVTIVIDFVFNSTWPQDQEINKATYDWGFNAVLEGVNYPKSIPRPTETTTNPHTHRYSITLDKGDYYSGDFLYFHLKNLSPEKMYWQDRKFEGEVIKMDKLITITVPVDIR